MDEIVTYFPMVKAQIKSKIFNVNPLTADDRNFCQCDSVV